MADHEKVDAKEVLALRRNDSDYLQDLHQKYRNVLYGEHTKTLFLINLAYMPKDMRKLHVNLMSETLSFIDGKLKGADLSTYIPSDGR